MSEHLREKIYRDLTHHIRFNRSFLIWMTGLTLALGICLVPYIIQLRDGLGITGLGDYVSWGIYISNFVFFVATSLIGMLISSVLILTGQNWAKPLARIAEIIALAFAAVAGLVIVMDMGRPDRVMNVIIHARVQSPIFWDVTVITTYMVISFLLYYIPLIPDLKILSEKFDGKPGFFKQVYAFLSLGYTNNVTHNTIISRTTRMLASLIIPVALAIHTVTSWLLAATSRAGWDSTIFGPYFISGAFVAGAAAVILAMYFFRNNYKLHDYIKEEHFEKMGRLLILMAFVYFYFNINEILVPAYKMKKAEAVHLYELLQGHHAMMFWLVQIFGLLLPMLLLLLRRMRKPIPLTIVAAFVLTGAWFKRYLIVIPTQEHPFLPVQNVPEYFKVYVPTFAEILITIAPLIMVVLIISTLAKLFPVIPISETIEAHENKTKE